MLTAGLDQNLCVEAGAWLDAVYCSGRFRENASTGDCHPFFRSWGTEAGQSSMYHLESKDVCVCVCVFISYTSIFNRSKGTCGNLTIIIITSRLNPFSIAHEGSFAPGQLD